MKIAVIGNYATQFLYKPLNKGLKKAFDKYELYQAEFNTVDVEIIDPNSGLFEFSPDYIIWHESTLGVRNSFYQINQDERSSFSNNYINRLNNYLSIIKDQLPNCIILFPDHSLVFPDNVIGNYFSKVAASWQFQISKTNYLLLDLSNKSEHLYLINSLPANSTICISDYSLVINAELHFTLEYLQWLSDSIVKVIASLNGKFVKCVVLDLDNTLWGGIIGDDGVEKIHIGSFGIGKAFSKFQIWLKELKNRGVILAVCSKNDEAVAKLPFLDHPEMILRLEDIAVFVANWESKADNINQIQKVLNIGFDSMVFIDDNPAERDLVRSFIPQIHVPELPIDPSDYLPFLIKENLFEITNLSSNDNQRTEQYRQESKRVELSKSITNMPEYLKSLDMKASIGAFNSSDIERIAQLTQRSNQFNLRTKRYNSNDITNLASNKNYVTFAVELVDKFGGYGLISVVIIYINSDKTATIDTWLMSCRVLKRTVEQFIMNELVQKLTQLGVEVLEGEYLKTEKNSLVLNLLDQLGMTPMGNNSYQMQLGNFNELTTYINKI